MRTIWLALIGALIVGLMPQSAEAEIYNIYKQRSKTYPDGQPCKEKDYWAVTQTIDSPWLSPDVYTVRCEGCGSTPCEIMKKPKLVSTTTVNNVLNQAVMLFEGGQLNGATVTHVGDVVITATWTGTEVGTASSQNIQITIE